jgi:hypothetical protein
MPRPTLNDLVIRIRALEAAATKLLAQQDAMAAKAKPAAKAKAKPAAKAAAPVKLQPKAAGKTAKAPAKMKKAPAKAPVKMKVAAAKAASPVKAGPKAPAAA